MTEVWFDPDALTFEKLLAFGIRCKIAREVWTTTPAQHQAAKKKLGERAHHLQGDPKPDKDPKYYLGRTPWRHIPMTSTQASRCNAMLVSHRDGDPAQWLSPRQREWFAAVKRDQKRAWPIAVDVPLVEAWTAAAKAKLAK